MLGALLFIGLFFEPRAEAATAEEPIQYVVVKASEARFQFPEVGRSNWSAAETAAYRPPFARVARSFKRFSSGPYRGHHEILIDNGQGNSMSGYVNGEDVRVFTTQEAAEAYALELDESRAHLEPVLDERGGAASVAPPTTGHATSPATPAPTPTPAPATTNTAPASASLLVFSNLEQAQAGFARVREKLRAELGRSFLAKLKPGFKPTKQDRAKLITAAASVLNAQERALFALVGTSWAEERDSVRDDRCSALTSRSSAALLAACAEDPAGRANMAFTMKIIDNRAEPLLANERFAKPSSKNKTKLQRYWSVVTDNHGAFSSWNIGSKNFGNMLSTLLGTETERLPTDTSALNRALATYRDFSSGGIRYRGFSNNGHAAVSMLNKTEVKDTRARRKFVSWSVEAVMRAKSTGTHEVGLRVPSFGISLPGPNGSTERTDVPAAEIGHWPVYLTRMKRSDMEAARLTQGGW